MRKACGGSIDEAYVFKGSDVGLRQSTRGGGSAGEGSGGGLGLYG